MDKKFEQNLLNFFSKYPIEKYKKGQIIIKPGTKPEFVGFVKSGYVRVYTLSEAGQEITMSFFKPVLYFTTIYAMTGNENRFYFEAISPVEMWKAPKGEFIDYCQKNAEVSIELMNKISNLFLKLVENMGMLLAGNSLSKVAIVISSINKTKDNFALTHKMVASLTGLTRETVTLQMLKLEKLKLIDNKNRKVLILDKEGLEKVIGK